MAQGKSKMKAGVRKKSKNPKKPLGPKKGGRAIAPKKNASSKATIVKKKLEVQIKTSIEIQAVNDAGRLESKPLKFLKAQGESAGKKKNQKKTGKNSKSGKKLAK